MFSILKVYRNLRTILKILNSFKILKIFKTFKIFEVLKIFTILKRGSGWEAGLVEIEDGFEVEVVGFRHEFEVIDPRRKALRMAEGAGEKVLKTQMPGRVIRLLVEEGQEVEEGQPVVVVEAMKMENEMKSPVEGTVRRICVAEGVGKAL